MRTRTSIVPLAALCLAAVPAVAATPESGSVSKDSPTVNWEGTAPGYAVFPTNLLLTSAGQGPAPCEQPYCDTFALTVADKADLNLWAAQRGADNFTELHVIKPDGEMIFAQSEDAEPVRVRVKAADPGEYTIEVMTNETVAGGGAYDASATLAVAGAPAPAGPPAPPAPSDPAAPSQPQPQPGQPPASEEPAATLGLATKAVSSRKSRKRLKLAVTSSKPVTDFRIVVSKGKKVVSRGKLASLDGKGSVALKVRRKLKRGTYSVAMSAKDGSRAVGLRTKLRVKK